jgi:VWFA-related protein
MGVFMPSIATAMLLVIFGLRTHSVSQETARPATQSQSPSELQSAGTTTKAATASQSGQAAEPQVARSNQAASTLRSTTRLVQLSVIVQDKHGAPVTRLSKDNFTIVDNGKRYDAQVFMSRVRESAIQSAAALPPDTYSNRMSDRSLPMSATVILLDGLNTNITDQQYARLQVIKFLQQIRARDRVALYTLGGDLRLLHDFTNDASGLLAALDRYAGRLSPNLDQPRPAGHEINNPLIDGNPQDLVLSADELDMFQPFLESVQSFQVRDRVWRTIAALRQIGNHVSLLPGRKNLVWVAGSFFPAAGMQDVEMNTPEGGLLFTTDLEGLERALNNASLVMYPVDAEGLTVRHPNYGSFAMMDLIAKRTGGRAFYERNDIFEAIREAVDDSRVSYEIGYYPENKNWDGSFHKVRVMVNKPGVQVRTREGYFAAPKPKITPEMRQAFWGAAVTNLLDADGIGVTVRVNPPNTETKTNRQLRLSVVLDSGDLSVEQKDTSWTGTLDTVFVQLDGKGAVLTATDDAFQFRLTPDQYQRMMREGLSYGENVTIADGAAELRVLVRDAPSGKMGATKVPLAPYFGPTQGGRSN